MKLVRGTLDMKIIHKESLPRSNQPNLHLIKIFLKNGIGGTSQNLRWQPGAHILCDWVGLDLVGPDLAGPELASLDLEALTCGGGLTWRALT